MSFWLISLSELKDIIEIFLFITLILFNIGKINQLISTKKKDKKNETENET